MSFTSQNYGVGKYKRMDKVLIDCLILSSGMALVMGGGAYLFGTEILQIYTGDPEVIRCGMEILSITTVPYFLCGIMDLFPGALRGMGCSAVPMILSVIGTVGTRIVWIFGIFPQHRSLYVLFISYDYHAGDLLSDCAEESPQPGSSRIKKKKKTKSQKNRG